MMLISSAGSQVRGNRDAGASAMLYPPRQERALGAGVFLRLVGLFVGVPSECFDEALKASPFLRRQGEKLETDAPVPAPAHDGLPNGQRRLWTRHLDAEGERGTGMNSRSTDDPAASQGKIDHGALSFDTIH
ncbi:MAG: hypothetical protein LZF60_20124 [Nitrospira sp.]|nr:MAG: hypothetical protein LZF60_20124 [Nitrospira sp.]